MRELLEQRETEGAATRDASGRRQRPKDRVMAKEEKWRREHSHDQVPEAEARRTEDELAMDAEETGEQRRRRIRSTRIRAHIPTQHEIDAMKLQKRKDLFCASTSRATDSFAHRCCSCVAPY